ncbi:GNAT family N-acetyltransferase [Verrucomicrobiales bacterium]|nr:GNAT family N-acetyltransferase [bacterium]MDC0503601.1 GNAT family N-acetyltransferase [Verrucomicrobiales bacterium]
MSVHPRFQRRGYATELMAAAESLWRDRGCAKIKPKVRASNTGVIQFYSRQGFSTENVLSMGKRLEVDGIET